MVKTRRQLTKFLLLLIAAGILVAGSGLMWLYGHAGMYGLNVLLQRGGSYWSSVEANSSLLSSPMRLALRDDVPVPVADPPEWREVAPGLAVAEMTVRAGGAEVDRLLLTRIDTAHLRLVVRTAPAGNRDLQDWMRELGAVLVVNGSYYTRYGAPDTPLVSSGVLLGPEN